MKKFGLVLTILLGMAAQGFVVPSIENFSQVPDSQTIFRGARPGDKIPELAAAGIKTIINLQGGDYDGNIFGGLIPYWEDGETPSERAQEGAAAVASGMQYFNIPLNSLKRLDQSQSRDIEKILKIMSDPANQPVYVHCAHGVDRTGLVIALYRLTRQNWSADDAYKELQDMGHRGVRLITTWPIDEYFWRYAKWMKKKAARTQSCQPLLAG